MIFELHQYCIFQNNCVFHMKHVYDKTYSNYHQNSSLSVYNNASYIFTHIIAVATITDIICGIYDAMLSTERLEFWWNFEDVISYTYFILKTQFIWVNQAWFSSNNFILSKLHTNVKIQTVFCRYTSKRKIQNISPPVYFRSY
jgi:hypothetical protein